MHHQIEMHNYPRIQSDDAYVKHVLYLSSEKLQFAILPTLQMTSLFFICPRPIFVSVATDELHFSASAGSSTEQRREVRQFPVYSLLHFDIDKIISSVISMMVIAARPARHRWCSTAASCTPVRPALRRRSLIVGQRHAGREECSPTCRRLMKKYRSGMWASRCMTRSFCSSGVRKTGT